MSDHESHVKSCFLCSAVPEQEKLEEMQQFYKTFGDATRLKILFAMQFGEMCVSHLASATEINQTTLSHQLSKLHAGRIVKKRKEGKMVYYSLDDEHVLEILKTGLDHISHDDKGGQA